jgi:hypothetical protein
MARREVASVEKPSNIKEKNWNHHPAPSFTFSLFSKFFNALHAYYMLNNKLITK